MNKKRIKRNAVLSIIMIVLLVFTNIVTYVFTKNTMMKQYEKKEQYEKMMLQKEKEKKESKRRNKYKGSFELDSNKLKDIKYVMIVAHPDDEILWGGDALLKDKFLVICITNGKNKVRREEFQRAMKETDDYGIILNYSDKVNGVRSNWYNEKDAIQKDIAYVLNYKKWDKIITHNPNGEYGHIHHKNTSNIVTKECLKQNYSNRLFYFREYFQQDYLIFNGIPEELNQDRIQLLNKIMSTSYKSQAYAYQKFKHMIPYEKIISFNTWFGIE